MSFVGARNVATWKKLEINSQCKFASLRPINWILIGLASCDLLKGGGSLWEDRVRRTDIRIAVHTQLSC
jgi:hypothetical protein